MKKITLILFVLFLQTLVGGCGPAGPRTLPAVTGSTQTVSAIHTRVAGTLQAAAALTPSPGAEPTATQTAPQAEPAATIEPGPAPASPRAAIPTAMAIPTMVDVPRLEGYPVYGSRVLAQPAAVVRDSITLAVEQVTVYQDHVELVYTVRDIPHASLFDPFNDDPGLSCGGPDSYPNLLLPNGTVIYPESYLLDGKARGMFEPFAASYLIHIYRASIPAEVQDLTLYLHCLELPRLDSAPLDWFVPFLIVPAAGGG